MEIKIYAEVTIVYIDKMNYCAISEIRYSLSKQPDRKIMFSFTKKFLDGNKIKKEFFWERLRNLEKEEKLLRSLGRRGIHYFCQKAIRMPVLILEIYPTFNLLVALPSLLPVKVKAMI